MAGDITTRAIHATARWDVGLAESDGNVVALITALTFRMQVPIALTAPIKVTCFTVADSTVGACWPVCTGQGADSMVLETVA
jgi:hypothetical protein